MDDFDRFGLRALVPISIFQAGATMMNLAAGASVSEPAVYLNMVLAVLAMVVFAVRHRTVQRGVTLLYAAILIYGTIFVWARPGAMDQVLPG